MAALGAACGLSAEASAAVLYGAVSLAMNFANKMLFAETAFDSVLLLLLLQFASTVAALYALRAAGACSFQNLTPRLARDLLPPSLLYCLNVGAGLASLNAVSIPVYSVLKRLTPVATLIVARAVTGKSESARVHWAILAILVGTVCTGLGDLRFDASAYAYGIASVLTQSLYLTYIELSGLSLDVNTILLATSVDGSLLLLAYGLMTDLPQAAQRLIAADGDVWRGVAGLLLLGGALQYSMFLCTSHNSALLTTVVGVIKAVASSFIGFFVFGGQPLTPLLVAGITINTGGAIAYMLAKAQEKTSRQSKQGLEMSAEQRDAGADERGRDQDDQDSEAQPLRPR
jgi:solute carrier family 35 protein